MTETFALGLIGYPLSYSLSPALHNAALRASGLAGEYRCYPVAPLPDGAPALQVLLERMRQGELHGLNVTIPHKQAVLPYLDRLSSDGKAIGAVNTIALHEGRLVGHNTDAAGFLADLRKLGWLPAQNSQEAGDRPRRALILGAGGAARAVACALLGLGWGLYLAARRFEAARELAGGLGMSGVAVRFAPAGITPLPLQPASLAEIPAPDLLVNATPAGAASSGEPCPWPAGLPLPAGAAVYDLVYHPAETPLLRAARAAGLQAANGTGMLVEQAALAFQLWTGRGAPVEAMRQAVESLEQ